MAETITYNFYEGSQKVDKIERQVNNYNYGRKESDKELITPDTLRAHIDLVLPFITNSRHWFSVCKIMMRLSIVGEGDFDSAVALINAAYPNGLPVTPNPSDLSRMDCGTWKNSEPEDWACGDADPVKKGVPVYKTIAQRFRDSF